MENKELGIYIHIPFCKSKCYYCDFLSYTERCDEIENYIQKVMQEMEQYDLSHYHVTTIYIGGGTPSFIEAKYMEQLLQKLKMRLINNETKFEEMEITLEMNPGTVTKEKLESYKKVGINRMSMGLQTTNDDLLKQIGRIHTYQQFLQSYQWVRDIGFENVNIDFMIGIPNQTIQDIKTTLEEIKRLQPEHVSVYSLIVEEGTKLERFIEDGVLQLPTEELERQMYWYVKNTLELNGYEHYEISNFAKKGKASKHNLNCWEQKEYIGLGVAAHSYLDGVRYSNTTFSKDGVWDFLDKRLEERQSLEDKKKEYMLLGLRKIQGVSVQMFKERYGDNPIFLYRKIFDRLIRQGLLEINGDWIRLTTPGIDFANLVWQEFI